MLAMAIGGAIAVTPVAAQRVAETSAHPPQAHVATVAGRPTREPAAPFLAHAIRDAAREHAAGMIRSTSATAAASTGQCAKRVVLLTVAGAAVGLISAGVLLASTGGSDDTSGILTRWTLAGTAAGAGVGALICLAP
jgi:hypothetical protein